MVADDHLQLIHRLGGDDGVSAGLRRIVTAGALALSGNESCALFGPIEDMQREVDRLAQVCGRRTPSGAWWAPDGNESMPPPDLLDATGDVVASPGRVVIAGDGALQIDVARGLIEAQRGDEVAQSPIDLPQLLQLAVLFSAALAGLAPAPGSRALGHGLVVHRLPDGGCRLALDHVMVATSARAAWVLAAELLSAVVAQLGRSVEARQQLERQLEASHG